MNVSDAELMRSILIDYGKMSGDVEKDFDEAVLVSPNWSNGSYSAWEYHVPELLRGQWNRLGADAQLIAYLWAKDCIEVCRERMN